MAAKAATVVSLQLASPERVAMAARVATASMFRSVMAPLEPSTKPETAMAPTAATAVLRTPLLQALAVQAELVVRASTLTSITMLWESAIKALTAMARRAAMVA